MDSSPTLSPIFSSLGKTGMIPVWGRCGEHLLLHSFQSQGDWSIGTKAPIWTSGECMGSFDSCSSSISDWCGWGLEQQSKGLQPCIRWGRGRSKVVGQFPPVPQIRDNQFWGMGYELPSMGGIELQKNAPSPHLSQIGVPPCAEGTGRAAAWLLQVMGESSRSMNTSSFLQKSFSLRRDLPGVNLEDLSPRPGIFLLLAHFQFLLGEQQYSCRWS